MQQEIDAHTHGDVVLPGQAGDHGENNGAGLAAHHHPVARRADVDGSGHGAASGVDAPNLQTESRLQELKQQISESESYLRIVRESLRLDDATVRVLTQQLIKRIDLIDDMIASYRHQDAGDVVEQLDLLRETFLDMLREHSVEPYTFEPGTQLSLARRRRIKIVESRTEANPGSDGAPHPRDDPARLPLSESRRGGGFNPAQGGSHHGKHLINSFA